MKKEIAERIVVDGEIRFGKATIKGTRVPVELVIGKLSVGMSFDEICTEYDLTVEDILAALKYAAQLLQEEHIRATT